MSILRNVFIEGWGFEKYRRVKNTDFFVFCLVHAIEDTSGINQRVEVVLHEARKQKGYIFKNAEETDYDYLVKTSSNLEELEEKMYRSLSPATQANVKGNIPNIFRWMYKSFEEDVAEEESEDLEEEEELSTATTNNFDITTILNNDDIEEIINYNIQQVAKNDLADQSAAIKRIINFIQLSTTPSTLIPKPLKFLEEHIPELKKIHKRLANEHTSKMCADIISVASMISLGKERDCLTYKLLGINAEINHWGHEYIRRLSVEIIEEMQHVSKITEEKIMGLATQIVPYFLKNNAEIEACDFAIELNALYLLERHSDKDSYLKICSYLTNYASYAPHPEDLEVLHSVLNIYMKFEQFPLALRIGIKVNNPILIRSILGSCTDENMKKQLAFMIARQQVILPQLGEDIKNYGDADCQAILKNRFQKQNFLYLAQGLDVMAPKAPEDIYKTTEKINTSLESTGENMGHAFVSGFVNAGFGSDLFLSKGEMRHRGFFSDTAAVGLLHLWDVEGGMEKLKESLDSEETHIKAGALLAHGIMNCGVQTDQEPLLDAYIKDDSGRIKIGAILGLGLTHAGTNRKDIMKNLCEGALDESQEIEIVSLACLSCGLIAAGTADVSVSETAKAILQCLQTCTKNDLESSRAIFIALALGFIYLGKQTAVNPILQSLVKIPEPYKSMAITLVHACAYAGTGNVSIIQKLLHICSEAHLKKKVKVSAKDKNPGPTRISRDELVDFSLKKSVAVLGIALIAMGEENGTVMAFRSLSHLLRYCDLCVKRVVPLAMGLLSVSNPRADAIQTLSKYSYDHDVDLALNSTLAMGIIGAGTNNAQIAFKLRQLSLDYDEIPRCAFITRIAQGLLYLGKGSLSLTPFHSDGLLMNPVGVAGLLSTLVSFLDVEKNILGHDPYMLYCLTAAIQPRMLLTLDEKLQPLPVQVKVGKAVDTTGVVGNPATITGIQLYPTPVILEHGERVELATEEFLSLSPILEGVVILKKRIM